MINDNNEMYLFTATATTTILIWFETNQNRKIVHVAWHTFLDCCFEFFNIRLDEKKIVNFLYQQTNKQIKNLKY